MEEVNTDSYYVTMMEMCISYLRANWSVLVVSMTAESSGFVVRMMDILAFQRFGHSIQVPEQYVVTGVYPCQRKYKNGSYLGVLPFAPGGVLGLGEGDASQCQ